MLGSQFSYDAEPVVLVCGLPQYPKSFKLGLVLAAYPPMRARETKMSTPFYVTYQPTPELEEKALQALKTAQESGKIRKGTNETTKAIERGIAKLVLVAKDVQPPEVVAHIPLLCDEKKVPYVFITEKKKLGEAAALGVGAAAACVVELQNKDILAEIANSVAALKKSK